ncbi:hypothetical protein NO1_0555 [Candidatus Termititenax aidoneus]|uniref:Uncharacterized protein n=1 Tax=Termititenax aidoneus TaxID=2218524 RepID=A0A388TBL0_TERA1|nr:hypothetical protein NO1_0555 [Candidatus Termititenax aidoneus]
MSSEIISQSQTTIVQADKEAITKLLAITAILKSVTLTKEQITTWISAIEKDIAEYKIDPDRVIAALDNLRFKHSNFSGLDYADFAEDCRETPSCRRSKNRKIYLDISSNENNLKKNITDYGEQNNEFIQQMKKNLEELQVEKAKLETLPEVKDLIAGRGKDNVR